jgi:hypothetical protein
MLPGSDITHSGLLDMRSLDSALGGAAAAESVINVSLLCLETITSWEGLSAAHHRPLLVCMLRAMAAPHTVSQPSSSTPSQCQACKCLPVALCVLSCWMQGILTTCMLPLGIAALVQCLLCSGGAGLRQ